MIRSPSLAASDSRALLVKQPAHSCPPAGPWLAGGSFARARLCSRAVRPNRDIDSPPQNGYNCTQNEYAVHANAADSGDARPSPLWKNATESPGTFTKPPRTDLLPSRDCPLGRRRPRRRAAGAQNAGPGGCHPAIGARYARLLSGGPGLSGLCRSARHRAENHWVGRCPVPGTCPPSLADPVRLHLWIDGTWPGSRVERCRSHGRRRCLVRRSGRRDRRRRGESPPRSESNGLPTSGVQAEALRAALLRVGRCPQSHDLSGRKRT